MKLPLVLLIAAGTAHGRVVSATDQRRILLMHNKYRCMHGVEQEVVWDRRLAESASQHVEYLSEHSQCTLIDYSDLRGLNRTQPISNTRVCWSRDAAICGENLARIGVSDESEVDDLQEAIDSWYLTGQSTYARLSSNYRVEIRANPNVENFLAVLWPDITYMGCGESICSLKLEDQTLRFRLISCEYSARVQHLHGTYTWKPKPPTVTPEAECAAKARISLDGELGGSGDSIGNSPEIGGNSGSDKSKPEGDTMSEWSEWSVCTAGVLMTTRTKKCLGSCSSTEPLETQPCPKFSPWTEWSDCVGQALGGPGQAKRTRECLMTPCSPNDVLKELQDCIVPKCGKKDLRDSVFCTRMLRDGDCAYSNVREELCVDTCCDWKEGAKIPPAPQPSASEKTPLSSQTGEARGVQVWSDWGDWGDCMEPGRQTRKRTCEGWGCPDALGDYIKDLPAEIALEQDQPCTGPECSPDRQRPEYCAIQRKIGNCKFASVRDRLCMTTCCWITDRLSFYSNR